MELLMNYRIVPFFESMTKQLLGEIVWGSISRLRVWVWWLHLRSWSVGWFIPSRRVCRLLVWVLRDLLLLLDTGLSKVDPIVSYKSAEQLLFGCCAGDDVFSDLGLPWNKRKQYLCKFKVCLLLNRYKITLNQNYEDHSIKVIVMNSLYVHTRGISERISLICSRFIFLLLVLGCRP